MLHARGEEELAALLARLSRVPLADDAEGLLPRDVGSKPAAVLILVLWQPDGWQVVLTRRTAHLRSHAGQISFPGGRLEEGDADVAMAALREAEEEIGLPASAVRVVAQMGQYQTITGYAVTPVLGVLTQPVVFRPSPDEVDEVFTLPLSLALDTRQYERHHCERDGYRGHYYSLTHGEYYVWGATAAMLRRLALAHDRELA